MDLHDYADWTGDIYALTETATCILDRISSQSSLHRAPTKRLVQHYQNVGTIERAPLNGRRSVFEYRHLLQAIATRVLLDDGWKLPKIAEFTSSATNEALLSAIDPTAARSSDRPSPDRPLPDLLAPDPVLQDRASPPPSSDARSALDLVARLKRDSGIQDPVMLTAYQARIQPSASGPKRATARPSMTSLRPTAWLSTVIDHDRLASATDQEIDAATSELNRLLRASRNQSRS